MKKTSILSLILAVTISCNNSSTKSSDSSSSESTSMSINDYDPNRGEGRFTEVDIPATLDEEMANKGEAIFNVKCGSCHKLSDEKLVGPGFKGVTERRTAVWILNFLTNTDEMIDLDPELQAQLELCLVRMPNQNLTDDETRSIYEFMRKNDGVK